MRKTLFALVCLFEAAAGMQAQRTQQTLEEGWLFHRGETAQGAAEDLDDSRWERVSVPHDWAITGPFDRQWDLQNVAVVQNGEKVPSWKTGRSGGLPYIGVGWYRRTFNAPASGRTTLLFDGAMSEARVYVNGQETVFWPYGYSSFHVDVTGLLHRDGRPNTLAVRLENREQSSRWYPGAGLYRNVHLIHTSDTHIPVWGTQLTTPHVSEDWASVRLRTTVRNPEGKRLRLVTHLLDLQGDTVSSKDNTLTLAEGQPFEQNFIVRRPRLWSPESPALYEARTTLYADGQPTDTYTTRFGIRSVSVVPDMGFLLNGRARKFRGVCLHHDLGPLGAAVNVSAIRHQLRLLKTMGCDAIRTSHNMPAPELVRLCDEMGFLMMLEPFDEWDTAKCKNGYHRFFAEWSERDMVNMLHQYRNAPSVVMWSIGNEVPSQWQQGGREVARRLQDICHREDPTRPVTCGMDQVSAVLDNGFAALLDVPGFNYRTHRYLEAYRRLPQNMLLGTETSSTVSSRGTYMFPARLRKDALYPNHQSSGYDLEACSWSNTPDEDLALADDHAWTMGQFVWTGFDYLGEPSPYDTDAWPSHSSLFGIIDLASLPKDRYYLYQSQWAQADMLYVLPHWTWPGREGQTTPVMAYTNHPAARLYINGRLHGTVRRLSKAEAEARRDTDPLWLQRRYRLIWDDVPYEPGEIRVEALDSTGHVARTAVVRTAGQPHRLLLSPARHTLTADGKDLCYVTVSVVDRQGNLCPHATSLVQFSVSGAGRFRAAANGDPSNLELFHLPRHSAFAGQLTAIVQSTRQPGRLTLTARAKGLKPATLTLETTP